MWRGGVRVLGAPRGATLEKPGASRIGMICATRRMWRVMVDWIFQANLKRYDVHAEAAHFRTWRNTPWHRAEIAINDRVWLQIAGPYTPGLHYGYRRECRV